ncbi:MAG: glycerol-3-phosphate 1-O-acyltransferase PlsY [Alphaproteobacteria bacterium]|nr:glycerol-3-phosphate 1-O-acyltransferase PlsY [Alphaproteobacteria bacterium]MCD8526308.1 glycerol-3-phosphate 1-O-acyltransferase PlsY [Alphaproteobacteria bacterium]MCD8571021.1 glycerol-3-phosphate 1-O-acyltransferase PlsY [Alphaproteobacteria bacterium]
MDYIAYLLAFLMAYLIGSIPFGLVLTKLAGYGDIRQIGSGNIGATNVLRTGNKLLALATLILDSGKGAFAVIVVGLFYNIHHFYFPAEYPWDPAIIMALTGLFAILGHCFPVWLKFKGGKGVATTIGTLLAAVPYAGLAACIVWLLMAFTFRISSLAALTAMAAAPLVTLYFYGVTPAVICALITILVFWRHKDNIKRLLKGEEPRIGKKK